MDKPSFSKGSIDSKWQPKVDYRLKLKDIKNQPTPSEIYRNLLLTSEYDERIKKRLEWRWSKNFARWNSAALLVQSYFRGMLGRKYFRSIVNDLMVLKSHRIARIQALDAFKCGNKELAAEILSFVPDRTTELYKMEAKISYTTGNIDQSLQISDIIIGNVQLIFSTCCW